MPRVSQEAVLGEVAHRAARESIGGASVIRPLPSRTFHARHRRWQEQQAELQSNFPTWVNIRNPHREQMFSALLPTTDVIRQRSSWATSIIARAQLTSGLATLRLVAIKASIVAQSAAPKTRKPSNPKSAEANRFVSWSGSAK
jgi:hypothetical protein